MQFLMMFITGIFVGAAGDALFSRFLFRFVP